MASVRARLYGSLCYSPGMRCYTTIDIFAFVQLWFLWLDAAYNTNLLDFVWELSHMFPQEKLALFMKACSFETVVGIVINVFVHWVLLQRFELSGLYRELNVLTFAEGYDASELFYFLSWSWPNSSSYYPEYLVSLIWLWCCWPCTEPVLKITLFSMLRSAPIWCKLIFIVSNFLRAITSAFSISGFQVYLMWKVSPWM